MSTKIFAVTQKRVKMFAIIWEDSTFKILFFIRLLAKNNITRMIWILGA